MPNEKGITKKLTTVLADSFGRMLDPCWLVEP